MFSGIVNVRMVLVSLGAVEDVVDVASVVEEDPEEVEVEVVLVLSLAESVFSPTTKFRILSKVFVSQGKNNAEGTLTEKSFLRLGSLASSNRV